jgi:hypothetical protein
MKASAPRPPFDQELEACRQYLAATRSERTGLAFTVPGDDGSAIELDVAAIHRAIAAAVPQLAINLPRDYYAPDRQRSITLNAYFGVVEARLAYLTEDNAKVRAELAGWPPAATAAARAPRETVVERDEKGRMSRLIESDASTARIARERDRLSAENVELRRRLDELERQLTRQT